LKYLTVFIILLSYGINVVEDAYNDYPY
jgi:hypothetical protein